MTVNFVSIQDVYVMFFLRTFDIVMLKQFLVLLFLVCIKSLLAFQAMGVLALGCLELEEGSSC